MKCLRPDCRSDVYSRGLCMADYQAARILIKAGEITWERLEKSKRCLAKSKKGAASKAWLLNGTAKEVKK